jgi:hypothetical protein
VIDQLRLVQCTTWRDWFGNKGDKPTDPAVIVRLWGFQVNFEGRRLFACPLLSFFGAYIDAAGDPVAADAINQFQPYHYED